MGGSFLLHAVVYLTAAVFCVPLAKRLGMGSVLGYLLAGIIIGPFVLGFVGKEGEGIMHFAEFGVVMMLFLVGLELEPAKFWHMRKMVIGVGSMQVLATAALLFGAGITIGFSWQASLSIGLALAMSSTAIVLQSLKEKGLLQTEAGQYSFAVLLFQDIAVIPILAILPLLAVKTVTTEVVTEHATLLEGQPGWIKALSVLGAVVVVIIAGRYVIVPLLRLVAKTRLRELFSASSLLIIAAIAYLMMQVGLSPALGTFLAGVVLANSEFKHELESDLEPFKGLLLGLFFIAVGASINFHLVGLQPGRIAAYVLGIMIIKAIVLAVLGRVNRLRSDENILFALGLSQVGEFAFVLFSFITQLSILSRETTDTMMAVTALSMTVTPILLLINEKIIQPHLAPPATPQREPDAIDEKNRVIIAGFSHFGSTIGRFLRANGVEATILDNDPDRVDLLRKMGFKVYYGDATRVDLLESAGAAYAKLFVSAIDEPKTNLQMVETLRKHFPHLEVMIRSKNRFDAYELLDAGVQHIYRESIDTSVRLGVDVLHKLGMRHYSAYRAGQNFIKYDEAALQKLARHRHDLKQYIASVREQIALQEELLMNDKQFAPNKADQAWDSQVLREAINK
ncbi:MAG: cation:proton antiporter [Flavisolibacter sp.]|nr:cation:proton antiporter [Flavisolibacter sp.]